MAPSLVYSGLHNTSIFGHKLKIWKAHHTFLESRHAEVTKNLYYALSTRRSQIPIFFHGLHRSSKFQLYFGRALKAFWKPRIYCSNDILHRSSGFWVCLQPFAKYLMPTLVSMSNSTLWEKFSFCFSRVFC